MLKGIKNNTAFGIDSIVENLLYKGLNIDNRVVDNSKITDHHAIIPTENIGGFDLSKLSDKELKILKLIVTRFIVVLSEKQVYDETFLIIDIMGENFKASGKKIIDIGWKGVEDSILGKIKNEDNDNSDSLEDQIFPDLKEGDICTNKSIELFHKKTKPPKPYNDASLLLAMEHAGNLIDNDDLRDQMKDRGLGTPATRAGIIEKLIDVGYVIRKGKNIIPTENGIKFIELMPDKLKSPELTAEWEYRLNLINNGQEKSNNFISDIKEFVTDLVNEYKGEGDKSLFNKKPQKEIIGICPRCKRNVYESDKNFYCESFKEPNPCGFSIFKNDKFFADRGTKLTAARMKKLLKSGKVEIKNLKSKKGNTYNAAFIMEDTGKYINFKMEFIK